MSTINVFSEAEAEAEAELEQLRRTRRGPPRPRNGARLTEAAVPTRLRELGVRQDDPPGRDQPAAAARDTAEAETWTRVANLVPPQRAAELDSLLEVDPS